jgi:hypothetical protein
LNNYDKVISRFRPDVDEICALVGYFLGYYEALSGNSVPTFRDNLTVPSSRVKKSKKVDFLILEDGTNKSSRNVGTVLPLNAEYYPRRAHFLDFLTLEDWTDRLSRNVGTELPLNAA